MRAGVWKAAIVVAGLGLVVALAGWMGGEGRAVTGQEAEGGQDAKADALPAGTDIELIVHRIVPRTYKFQSGRDWITATREEAAMLEGVRTFDQPLKGSLVGPRVWFTLVNHTDTGYLITEHTLYVMLVGRVRYTDELGRVYGLPPTGLFSFSGEEFFTVPLTPGGRREMVMSVGLTRLQRADEPTPFERPAADADAILGLQELSYDIVQRCELLARPVEDGRLGERVTLRVHGRGICEVSFDGPM